MVTLSQDQKIALSKLLAWNNTISQNAKFEYITLGGYAGTGKTTLISIFRKLIHKSNSSTKVAFCSYTGKGALVLKKTLIENECLYKQDSVGTIHALIYDPIINAQGNIVGWKIKDKINQNLIIIDEASMVDITIWNDLISFNIPIIAVGDQGQLPPINNNFNLMNKPNLILNQIHRQAKNNPIIKLSIDARETGIIKPGEYGKNIIKITNQSGENWDLINEYLEDYNNETLVLCGYNNTRIKINNFIRLSLGFDIPEPQPQDRVICLRNNHKLGIYNGMMGIIQNIYEWDENWYEAQIQMLDVNQLYTGQIYAHQFNKPESINYTKDRKKVGDGDLFDFGYAITVHKSQGSQADRVILFEERFSKSSEEDWKRWLYTAVTRAKKELIIVGN